MRAGELCSVYDLFGILLSFMGLELEMGWEEMRLNSHLDTHENASEIRESTEYSGHMIFGGHGTACELSTLCTVLIFFGLCE